MFTKRHYEAIAAVISMHTEKAKHGAIYGAETEMVANSLAKMFAAGNPAFNRSRFMTACGIAKPSKIGDLETLPWQWPPG